MLLLNFVGSAGVVGCDSEETCESATVYRLDLTNTCYEPVDDGGLEACRVEAEKGTEFVCGEHTAGEPHMAVRNTAARLRGGDWQFAPNVSEETERACAQIIDAVGYPTPATYCQ
jgi:hypothetical protein